MSRCRFSAQHPVKRNITRECVASGLGCRKERFGPDSGVISAGKHEGFPGTLLEALFEVRFLIAKANVILS